jgi:hypothetical protein
MRLPLLLLLFLPITLSAQVVRGVVRDSASGAPASGVLVTLVQSTSGARRTVLTDETGRFTIGAPGSGTYTLEVKRIGVRPDMSPAFTLTDGEAREIAATVAPLVARLDAVRVTGRSYCGERVLEGAETATLWEEVRAALLAARITRDDRRAHVTITNFTRTLDPKSFEVQSEERSERSGVTANPFSSVPIASLSKDGYVVSEGDELQYRGPDVDVLLSDAFVREHCFRAVRGTSEELGLIGLSFEPTSARRVPDIAGVLWIDVRTRELRRLEYRYVRAPLQPQGRFPLSYVDFARMPSGTWIVKRWAIRMPYMVLSGQKGQRPTNPLVVAEPERERLIAVIETGGEAFVGVRQSSRDSYVVEGTVFDSTEGRPLGAARVAFRGTPFAATADAGGKFRIQLPDSGAYMLAFEHPRLDSLNFDPPARTVRVVSGTTTADVAVPPLAVVRAALCPGSTGGAQRGIVHGTVRNPAGAPMAWATLKYRWDQFAVAAVSADSPVAGGASVPVSASAPGANFVADSRGRYLICDVPPGRYRLTVESEAGDRGDTELVIGNGQLVKRDLALQRR